MSRSAGSGRWTAALAASIAFHAAALGVFSGRGTPGETPPAPRGVTVELRRLEAPKAPPAGSPTVGNPSMPPAPVPEPEVPAPKKSAAKPARPQSTKSRPKPKPEQQQQQQQEPAKPSMSGPAPAATVSPSASSPRGSGGDASGAESRTVSGGGSEIVDVSRLRVSYRLKPDYPAIARRRGEEGTVTLLLMLEGGGVSSVSVEKSSGFSTLDEAAVAAVRRWRFENAGKIPVRVPVTFRLDAR